ncbi:MAG TPA: DUF885 domain-containing protein, partial [Bacteroidetes bacterium]|nr:DUF885 domain-containing protein [Bacteroidota bacterium]
MKYYFPFLALLVLLISGCDQPKSKAISNAPPPDSRTETEKLNEYLDGIFNAAVARNPEWESRLGKREHYAQWTDLSDAHQDDELQIRQAEVATMKKEYAFDKLDPQGQLSFRLFEDKVKWMEKSAKWRIYTYPVNQMHGVHSESASFLINVHRINDVRDAYDYVERLYGLKDRMLQVQTKLTARKEAGIIPPKFVFPYVLNDCRNLLKGQPFDDSEELSTLFKDYSGKIKALKLSETEEKEMLFKGRAGLLEGMKPAYEGLITFLEELEKVADDEDGAWKFPKGDEFYEFALQRTTTTALTAEEIHLKGLAEVERIHNEMREIMKKVKYKGELNAFFDFMRSDKQFYFENTDKGREQYLEEATAIIDTMRNWLPKIFNTLPKGKLVVKKVEPYREKSAGKAFYNKGAPDGSRPGTYYANLYNMA